MLRKPGVFLLQLDNLLLDRAILCAPLLVDVDSVFAKNRVIPKHQRRRNHRSCSDAPPHPIQRLHHPLQQPNLRLLPADCHARRLC